MATKAAEHKGAEDHHQQIKHFDNLKNILKNAKHTSGNDLYQHLVEVITHIVMHCPETGVDKFEEISYLLKQKKEGKIDSLADFLKVAEERAYSKPGKGSNPEAAKFLAKAKKLFDKKGAEASGEGAEGGDDAGADGGAQAGPCGYVPDLFADSRVFQWAGVGFGDNETLLLQKSLKQLAQSSGAGNIRLWGKIHGTSRDYYIAEGTSEAGVTEEEKPAGFEARGSGVNKFVYWATNSPLEAWTQLPDLAPSDIQAAREVKVHFSGDLEKKILTNPFFFKREKHLLRAQIARIAFGTSIVPKGVYKTVEENEKEIEDYVPAEGENKNPLSADVLSKPEMWVHHTQNILRANRLTHIDQSEGDETGEVMKKIEAADPYEKRLKSIALDQRVKGGLPAWIVKHCGEKDTFETVKSTVAKPDKVNFGVVVARSLQWPGSYTFFSQGRWLSVYVGDGLKYEQQTYYPIFPPKIREDPLERPCFHEPNPRGYTEAVIDTIPNSQRSGAEEEEEQ